MNAVMVTPVADMPKDVTAALKRMVLNADRTWKDGQATAEAVNQASNLCMTNMFKNKDTIAGVSFFVDSPASSVGNAALYGDDVTSTLPRYEKDKLQLQ